MSGAETNGAGGPTAGAHTHRATMDDLLVRRDQQGNLETVEGVSIYLRRTFKIIPVTYGSVLGKPLDKPVTHWPLEDKLDLVRRHVVEPDLSGLTLEKVQRDMDPWTFDEIVSVVVAYSGVLRGKTLEHQREIKGTAGKAKGARPGAKAKPRKSSPKKTSGS